MEFWSILLHKIWKIKFRLVTFLGGKTLGARALVLADDRVLLIRHTYCKGWYTIGGAVEAGETPMQCIIRELNEEVGISVAKQPVLQSVHYSNNEKRHDYVMMYCVHEFTMTDSKCLEIAEKRWFSLKELPHDISPATLRRIQEYLGESEYTEIW